MALFTVNYNGGYGRYYEFKAEVWETRADNYISTNSTTVNVDIYMRRTNVSSNGAWNNSQTPWTITIDGQTFNGTNSWDTRNSSDWKWLGFASKSVTHNSDGSKTVTISASHNSQNTSAQVGTASGSGTFTLTKIPRASTIKATDANIGSVSSIYITAADSSFSHTITYSFGSLSGTVVSKTKQSPYPFTVPTSFYAQIPNNSEGTVTLTCTTYSGNTSVGTSQTTFKAIVNKSDNKPTVSATVIDVGASTTTNNVTTVDLTGDSSKLIRYRSTAKITPTATAKNSATIKKITVNNTTVSGSSIQFTNVQSSTFQVVATDSRGYTNDEYILKPTFVEYIPLTLAATFYRTAATSSTVKLKYEGNFFNKSFGAVTNTLSLTWKYKLKGASSYTTGGTLTPTKSGNKYSGEVTLGTTFDYQQAYDFIIYASDKLTSLNIPQPVQKGEPIYDYGVDKNGANYLNVNGGLYVQNQAILDLVYPVGAIYMSVNSTNPGNLFGGTWVAWGTGKVPVGIDTSQSEFNSIEKTGGQKTVTLTIDQMPKHNHGQDAHTHKMNEYQDTIASGGYNNNGNQWGASFIFGGQPSSWTFTNLPDFYTKSAQPYIWENGGGQAHNNLQPYITCYMWKRTK